MVANEVMQGLSMDTACTFLLLLRTYRQFLLVLYSVIASAMKTLEKSFAIGELWGQTDYYGTLWKRQ